MLKKVYINGKRVKQPTERQIRIENILYEEKKLTAHWYARMSGEIAWDDGQREEYSRKQQLLSDEYWRLQKEESAEWFESLPAE
jgi:hypothetical protein